jgi:hypothetical protein
LPNSELLRKYGHTEDNLLPPAIIERLASADLLADWPTGNPFDEVHIAGDRIVHIAGKIRDGLDLSARVEWWLDEGQEESVPSIQTLTTQVIQRVHDRRC